MRDPERPGRRWLFAAPGGTRGPLSADELRTLVQRGELRADSHVCVTGTERWTEAGLDTALEEFFATPTGVSVQVHVAPDAAERLAPAEGVSPPQMLRTAVLTMVRHGGDRVELIRATADVCQLVHRGAMSRTLLHVVHFRPEATADVV